MNRVCADVVMLVDDNEIDLFINQKVLEFHGFAHELITFRSGRQALDFLLQAQTASLPDVIFLDLNMPVVDGFRFLYEFSGFPAHIRQKCSIVVLTSSDSMRDKEKIQVNEDVIQFISKPLNDPKLDNIRMLLQNAGNV